MLILSIALTLSAFDQQSLTVGDVREAGDAYANCLHYQAIRAHTKGSPPDGLVIMAQDSCRIERAIWRGMLDVSAKREDPNTTDAEIRIVKDTLDQRYVRSVIDTIAPILRDMER